MARGRSSSHDTVTRRGDVCGGRAPAQLQISVDKAILEREWGREVQLEVSSKQFPQLGYTETVQDRTWRAGGAGWPARSS